LNQYFPSILYEDNHLIAVAKKSGEPVQPERGKPFSLEEQVKQYIKVSKRKPGDVFLGVIHRLDMPVRGIVLFAKTSKALVRMNELFKKRAIQKIYMAKVEGKLDNHQNTLTHYLVRDDNKRITKAYEKQVANSQKAVLEYEVMHFNNNASMLKITLHTGRKHQIRVQLAKIGHPILGDVKYGASTKMDNGAIELCATLLSFEHPISKLPIQIVATF